MMELLSPAGGMEQLRAAARFGADAVYGGLKKFGLRAAAGNFDWDELQTALDLLHGQGKKFYLTLNILPYDDELDELGQSARRAAQMGVDAAIVSDLGAFAYLRREVPELVLHVSTQANVMNAEAANLFDQLGAERIVLSRELSLARIACSVLSSRVFRSQPSMAAPRSITSREQPAANFLSLYFFFRDFSSISCTLLEGRISAAAPISPVSSSVAYSTFSIRCSG